MSTVSKWKDKIFNTTAADFPDLALEIFHFQYAQNKIYRSYIEMLGIDRATITRPDTIPFLPIGFFKTHTVQTGSFAPQLVFESSGTAGMANSRHYVNDLSMYEVSFFQNFESFYGPVKDHCIIGLLPSYLERRNSSLVYMVDKLIRASQHQLSGFYLNEFEKLASVLKQLEEQRQKTLLIGVSFALLDLAEKHPMSLENMIIMERELNDS